MSDREKSWKEKAKEYLKYAVVIALFIWAFSIGQGAQSTATDNRQDLNTPAFQYSFIPGGPDRFSETYGDAINIDPEEQIEETQFLWTTVILENTSFGEAEDLELQLQTSVPVAHTLVTAPGFENEAEVSEGESADLLNIQLESLNQTDRAYLFVGVDPAEVPDSFSTASAGDRAQWARDYEVLLQRMTVDSDERDVTFYGKGVAQYFQ
jgi:hypothetical protein